MTNHSKLEKTLSGRSEALRGGDILSHASVYLSGPMDFVASREEEKRNGWRTRISQFLDQYGTRVFDPWEKPQVVGMPHYGKEDEFTVNKRDAWHYDGKEGDRTRAELAAEFWPTLHIDLRMVDVSDFVIAYCPTNVYSVGTVHEIVVACTQHKPVLFVSPKINVQPLEELRSHLEDRNDTRGSELFNELLREFPAKPNAEGIPSLWYMALVDPNYFFDGFGFEQYREGFGWERSPLDEREEHLEVKRPLLPFLASLNERVPKRFDLSQDEYVENPDWLIFPDEN